MNNKTTICLRNKEKQVTFPRKAIAEYKELAESVVSNLGI
jgi:hypothetical protein